MTGLDRAVWWTEYVIRHKGAEYLKSPWAIIPWYQYFLLDVLAFVVISVIVIVFVLYKTSDLIFKIAHCTGRKYKIL